MSGRWHFVQDEPAFEYSVLFTRSDAGDETRLLLAVGSSRLELLSAQDPSGNDSTESVRDAASGATFRRRLLLSGYTSVPGCAPVRPPDACVLFDGPGGTFATSLGRFHGQGGAAERAGAARAASPALAEKLLALAPLMGVTVELDAYGDDFLRLVWPDRFPRRTGAPKRARRTDGCAFDASFGHPCK